MEITGSPFYPEIYDPALVTVSDIEDGIVGDTVHFDGRVASTRIQPCMLLFEM